MEGGPIWEESKYGGKEEEESTSQADYSIAGAGLFLQLLQTLIHHKTTR